MMLIHKYMEYIKFKSNEKKSKFNLFLKGALRVYYYIDINKYIFINIKTLRYIVINLSKSSPKVNIFNEQIFHDNFYSNYMLRYNKCVLKNLDYKKLQEKLISTHTDLKSYFIIYYKLIYLLFF